MESEFIETALALGHVLYLQPIVREIGFSNLSRATILYGDNQPAIASVGNDSEKSRTKHIDVHLKFYGEVVRSGLIEIAYLATQDHIFDFVGPQLRTIHK